MGTEGRQGLEESRGAQNAEFLVQISKVQISRFSTYEKLEVKKKDTQDINLFRGEIKMGWEKPGVIPAASLINNN